MEYEEGVVQKRYKALRKQLDELGYRNILPIDALPLVERLVSDLLHTTESLRHYKELAQDNFKDRCFFEKGTEPYRLENASLVRECNELHLKTLQLAEEAEKTQKELKFRIRKLESENSDLLFLNSKFVAQVKELENESADKSRKIVNLQSKNLQTSVTTQGGKKKSLPTRQPTLEIDDPLTPSRPWKERYWSVRSQVKDPYIANMVEICDQRTTCLAREISRLREENRQQSDIICSLKTQLHNREKEIERLSVMLEGGRPVSAINKDCVYKDLEKQVAKSSEEIKRLEELNKELELKLRESVAQQHEAMTRALQLAERNKQLQNELHDIDRMALAVEAECSTTVKENTRKVSKIQEKLEASLNQINDLEHEILELKRSNQELQAELEDHRREKHNVQKVLDSALEEKKKLTDRINNYTVIEHDLMVEIDRLTQTVSQQKRRIAELENRTFDAGMDGTPEKLGNRRIISCKKDSGRGGKLDSRRKDFSSASSRSMSLPTERSVKDRVRFGDEVKRINCFNAPRPRCCLPCDGSEHVHGQMHGDGPENEVLEQLQAERDYYSKAYHNLKEQLNKAPAQSDESYELRRKLSDKEQELIVYQRKNLELCRERTNLISRLENRDTRDSTTSPMMECPGYTVKAVLKRLERERDMARGDVCRLEEERDALRERLKIATETQVTEHARLEKTIIESEDRVRRLEAERRELLTCQGSLKAAISSMEEQVRGYRDQLHSSQAELSQQRMLYNQIKSLHEQCERALGDCQGQLTQSELELTSAQDRIRELERDRACLDREVSNLKNDRTILRGQLAQLDQEKDGLVINLDDRTERVAVLEQELKAKENRILNLEDTLTELQKKLDITLDENGAREQQLRTAEREAEALRMELDTVERARECTLRENRRLQDDLAAATQDCRATARDLDIAREECEALKRQLQDYVSEIRRVEDLLAQKESERSEMLEHFRGLSMEASLLESNNHSLENEAYEKKNQLRQAQDRIIDLEQQLEMRDSLVHSYETQIAELTAHIASLETQMQQHIEQRRKTEADLTAVRDLCVKLDTQKDNMMQQITENDVIKIHLEHELTRLREEQELMQDHLSKDRASISSLEALLATSRQETVDQKLQNQELQTEVTRLRQKVDDLQRKLDNELAELRRYQNQAADYSQQVADLQRQITNERFERARAADESRSYSTTL
ncbi:centrosomal protein of 135 kDa [Anabrus simplex]|uniref:centrosomal protein of 135 kDa n=1 Tax=Anabrus simplex TaxID=316456 RepID=UPI0035A32C0D